MRILLVEDEDMVRELLADELARQGHVVEHARSCAEAMALTFRPELLVVDFKLPDGSGVELAQSLRASIPSLKILLMSGYDREQLPNVGSYLRKPFRIAQFREAIKTLL